MNHKKMTLDTERKSFESIIAMQGDNKSRYIDATIVNRSIPVDLTGCTVKFSAIKPDITDIFNDAVISDAKGGKVKIELTNQTLAVPGVIQATLVILKEDMQLSVLPFFITVIENPYNPNAIESKSEYKALNNALTTAEGYAKELQDASVNLEEKYTTRLNNFDEQLDNKANKYKSEIIGIKGWRQPNQDKKIVFVGDSTTDTALSIYSEIKKYYINSGDCLSGINESNLINKGSNGNTIANFINNIPAGKGIDDVIALKPDLVIFCYGINDVRLGNTTLERLIELHDIAITRLLKETNAYILLRTPHPLCSDSPNGFIQPPNAGQQYTDILWECYEHFRGKYPKTDVLDLQTLVFGRVSKNVANSPLMADELHANNIGQAREGSVIADFIGEKPKKDSYKARNSISYTDYPKLLENNPLYEKNM